MRNKIKNFIEILKKIKMTEEENEAVKANIVAFAKNNSLAKNPITFQKPSPYFSRFSFSSTAKVLVFAMLFLLIGVGGLSIASASALPGDWLYPVKIAKENIQERFVTSPQQRIALKQKRIETRFSEVETLIKEKKITPENRSIAETKIKEDTAAIGTDLEEINKTDPQAVIEAKTTLDASIQQHQEKIDTLITQQSDDASLSVDDSSSPTDENDFDGEINTDTTTTPPADTSTDTSTTTPTDGTTQQIDTPTSTDSSTSVPININTSDTTNTTQSSKSTSITQDIKVTSDASGAGSSSTNSVYSKTTDNQKKK